MPLFARYVISADFLYGLLNVIFHGKFSAVHALTLMSIYMPIASVIVIVTRWFVRGTDPSFDYPSGNALLLLLCIGPIFVAADYCFIAAYNKGGDLKDVTTLALLTPVFASLIGLGASLLFAKMTFTMPNWWQLGGYALAAASVWCIVMGRGATT